MIPNFFDPDSTSVAASKMTPLAVNNSYINVPSNSSKLIGAKINLNNGSFLETRNTPQKPLLNKSKAGGIPTFVITEPENKLDRSSSTLDNEDPDNPEQKQSDEYKTCQSCFSKIKIKKSPNDILAEFNLETEEYSPNKKCVNYLENINFSPTSVKASSSVTNTPQSSAKKTLLAKAIANNANTINEKSNISLDELSNEMLSELSSPVNSPSKGGSIRDQSFSNLDLSDLDSMNENDAIKSSQELCDRCKLIQKLESEKSKQNADNSDVSLIAIDNDNEYLNDGDDTNEANLCKLNKNKRKASLTRLDSDPNFHLLEDRRRSSILSELNANNNNTSQNNDPNDMKNKKFKNQVTSTPAAVSTINLNLNTASKLKTKERSKMCMQSPSTFMNTNDG